MLSFSIRRLSSFTYLNVTQFLGALNDNVYKLLVVFLAIHLRGMEESPKILALSGGVFVLPFLLFSASSGTLADRFSKRNVIVLTKVLEVVVMSLAVLAFHLESLLLGFGVLFLLATQSALFGPSKYGIIPEIVSSEKISTANGMMTSFTFLAIILGTFLASFLVDITDQDFVFTAYFCLGISVVGLLTSFCIEYTPPSGSAKRFNVKFLSEIVKSLYIAKDEPSLLMAIVGSSFFLFMGAYFQLNMIPFAVHALNLTAVQGGYLFLLTSIGIGTGAIVAGKISGKTVELGLVPIAGVGIAIGCFLIDLWSDRFAVVIPLVMLLGFFGGIFQVPLDSYIQVASPNKYRGQIVAATNFLSFFGVLVASFMLYIISDIFEISPDKGFSIIGTITVFVTVLIGFQFFDYLTRLIGSVLSRIHFQTSCIGAEHIPNTVAVYVCQHHAWNDTLLMLGAQRRRMRFFIEEEQEHTRLIRRMYRLLRVVLMPQIEPMEVDELAFKAMITTLKRDISVCIFIESANVEKEIEKLRGSPILSTFLEEMEIPIVPVTIEKGQKFLKPRFFKRLLEKVRIPAAVSFGETLPN